MIRPVHAAQGHAEIVGRFNNAIPCHLLCHGAVVRRVVEVSRGYLAPEVAAVDDLDAAGRAAGRQGFSGGPDARADHDVDVCWTGREVMAGTAEAPRGEVMFPSIVGEAWCVFACASLCVHVGEERMRDHETAGADSRLLCTRRSAIGA